MKYLEKIDMSDTINYRHRSDTVQGIKAILLTAVIPDKNVWYLDLSNNDLEHDGAKYFTEFLEKSQSLKVLKVNNC
jgi:Ran GTPase-activating protein (RanGAP) involved in mRNA processing and transport